MIKGLLLLLVLWVSGPVLADTVYRQQDERGRPLFTDQPAPGAQEVDVAPVNTLPAVTPRARSDEPRRAPAYKRVEVVVPSIIPNGLVPVTIAVRPEPALREGHRWRMTLDEVPVAESSGAGFTFPRLERGTHVVSVEIVDAAGKVVAKSDAVSFFVYWPGRNR